jgi:alanyl aminopeptidase
MSGIEATVMAESMAFRGEVAQATAVRALALWVVLAACGRPDTVPSPPRVATTPATEPVRPRPPGPRLDDRAAPVAYDLTLEIDPERATFTGRVAIAIDVAAPGTPVIWLHAVELDLARATVNGEPATVLDGGAGAPLRGLSIGHPIAAGPATVTLDYTGRVSDLSRRTGKDEEGLFRERADNGAWFVYSQAESVFARKIVPCFDEPRWKPAWRVTAVVPRGQVAIGNAPIAGERDLPGGRREVRFAEVARMASYTLAVAVGPFGFIDMAKLGRDHVPIRIAVAKADARRALALPRFLPRIVDALERYVDAPLPLAKLDLVDVPEFFGAMENPGLIPYDHAILVGGNDIVLVTAHELAHQWFGDAVTPAWWDELWLSEALASWLGERITRELHEQPALALTHRARREALAADDLPGAQAIIHPIATSEEVEPSFDAIAYNKGAAVIGMFEAFVNRDARGEPLADVAGDPFRAALRAYLAAHAGTSVTSRAFLDALARTTSPAVSAALAANLHHAGTPVVELGLRCSASTAVLTAGSRDGVTVPVCVRFPTHDRPPAHGVEAVARMCFLADAPSARALPASAGCPAWLVGNDDGRGYYRTVWRGAEPVPPTAQLTFHDRLVRGDDLALAVGHGEIALADALGELTALARTHDTYQQLAALAIAEAIDPWVTDAVRPAWAAWLAARFADRLTRAALESTAVPDDAVRTPLIALTRGALPQATLANVRGLLDRLTDIDAYMSLRIDAARDPGAIFEHMVAAAVAASGDARDELLAALGAFPAAFAPRVVDVVLEPRFAPAQVWPALAAMLARGESRTATWRAIHARGAAVRRALADVMPPLIAATGALCDAGVRGEVAADFTDARDHAATRRALDQALAAIDRCIARRAAAGDLARALAAPGSTPAR